MSAYHLLEIVIVVGAVAFSAWKIAQRLLPVLRRGKAATASGCSSCDSCGACGPAPAAQQRRDEQAVQWHRSH